ncbi:replication initiation protein [Arsenophonus nasoniae]|uniref:Replication initiation protein n=1 Tax=Arsenophonus nasoniae TaxID=638 RepID=A0AA95GVP3_9GAMM|nr:replication initiation protein [Arsenophonus nasoniae]WGM04036.1 replication initiation protein [Arsenophonus nasoniae]
MKVSKKTKIRHRNGINATLADMPLSSRRVLFLTIARVDPKKIMERGEVFRVYASDYSELCGIDKSAAYKQLKEAAKQLQQQIIAIPREQLLPPIPRVGEPLLPWKKLEGGVRMLNVTEYCDYMDGDGYIDIAFSRQMEPYICRLEKDFTTQILLSAVRLSDTNAIRLYQYLREKISAGKVKYFDISLEDLKSDLGVADSVHYKEFKYFNNQFIKRAISKIIEKTEFNVIKMEVIKRIRRKAVEVRISYEYEEN